MKRLITLLTFCLFFHCYASAQFIDIPQDCLRNQLKSKYPACFNGSNQLDTTCSAILSATSLSVDDCLGTENPNVEGVLKYFKSLQSLSLSYGDDDEDGVGYGGGILTFSEAPATLKTINLLGLALFDWPDAGWDLRNLPNTVETLQVIGTVVKLDKYPTNLKRLELGGYEYSYIRFEGPGDAFYSGIEELDFFWVNLNKKYSAPTQLKKLVLNGVFDSFEAISHLLNTLPNGVEYMDLEKMNENDVPAIRLPTNLPSALQYLRVASSPLTNDPLNLPSQLKILELSSKPGLLSALPASLEQLNLSGCNITNPSVTFSSSIPNMKNFRTNFMLMPIFPEFPEGMVGFFVSRAGLTELPPLPSSLFKLDVSFNDITAFSTLPSLLGEFYAQSNKLVNLPRLPANLRIMDVSRNPDLACLPALPASLQTLNFSGAQFICIPNETDVIKATPNRPLCTDSSRICVDDQPIFSGRVFLDINRNGVFDGFDQPLVNTLVQLQGSSRFATTRADGFYRLLGDKGIANTFSSTYTNPYLQSISPALRTLSPSAGGIISDTFNFAVRLAEVQDLEVHITNFVARPGFFTSAWVTVINRGGVAVNNATLQVLRPADWNFAETTPPHGSVSGDTLIWTGLNLPVGSSQTFQVQSQLPATATILGDPYTYWARILPLQNDQTPNNNVATRTGTIRGAYDPNDKLVDKSTLPPGYGPETELFYTIRFQNTGTDTAFNVVLTDTILSKLRPESIRIISASHDYVFDMEEGGVAVFTFENIMLPDSNVNEPASHGFVLLALKPLGGLAENAIIENGAAIFFDFNEPIITNIATTEVKLITSVSDWSSFPLAVYPNPSSGLVRVEWPIGESIVLGVRDMSGRLLFSRQVEGAFAELNLSNYPRGVYIIEVASGGKTAFAKVVMQ
jgi:uncharacterized repeat protein (TIGR01451 family)